MRVVGPRVVSAPAPMSSPSSESRLVTFAPRAVADIEDIFIAGLETWGVEQALSYDAALQQTVATLATFPHLGRERAELPAGHRSVVVQSHVIVYEVITNPPT